MEHEKLSKLLYVAGGIAAVGGAVLAFVYAPWAVRGNAALSAHFWGAMTALWVLVAVLAGALWQYICICRNIGKDCSFCAENVRRMKCIAVLLLVAAGLCVAYGVALACLTPGWLGSADMLIIGCACAAMGLLAFALHKLLKNAVALQDENDLTI